MHAYTSLIPNSTLINQIKAAPPCMQSKQQAQELLAAVCLYVDTWPSLASRSISSSSLSNRNKADLGL